METAVLAFLLKWGGVIALLVLAAERLARITPNTTDDLVVNWLRKVLKVLGVDFPNVDSYKASTPTESDK